MADADQLLAMADMYQALKSALSPPDVKNPNPWVTASKLCARKRPDLFPVRDNVVCTYLGLIDPKGNYQVDWHADGRRSTSLDDVTPTAVGRRPSPRARAR